MGLSQSLILPASPIEPGTPISMVTGKTPYMITDSDDEVVDVKDYLFSTYQKGILQQTRKERK